MIFSNSAALTLVSFASPLKAEGLAGSWTPSPSAQQPLGDFVAWSGWLPPLQHALGLEVGVCVQPISAKKNKGRHKRIGGNPYEVRPNVPSSRGRGLGLMRYRCESSGVFHT